MEQRTDRRTAHITRISRILAVILCVFTVFVLRLWQLQVVEGDEYRRLAKNNRIRTEKIPAPRGIIYDRNGIPLVKNVPAFDISVISEEFPVEMEALLASVLSMSPEELSSKIEAGSRYPSKPVKVKINASMEEVARVEARRLELPGVHVDVEVSRRYLYGPVASHVLGYLGRLRSGQANKEKYKHVLPNAYVGQWGLEAKYDEYLRGTPGDRIFEVNALGQKIREVGVRPPEKGTDLHLTIDLAMQKAAEDAFDSRAGAAVAIDPNNGEVLALVSRPTFDPNLFATGISSKEWNELLNDPKKPLYNRALQSQYPPGSTFKIVVALGALEEGIVTPEEYVTCIGRINLGRRAFRCWKRAGHGKVNLRKALVESCDVYFYDMALRLGVDSIADYAKSLGLASTPGLGLVREAPGIIPTKQWKLKKKNERWYPGETLNASIGQGFVSTSPFQIAQMIATLTNGGRVFKANLVKKSRAEVLWETELNDEAVAEIKDALQAVVEDKHGTARSVRSDITTIAGKTGTAQVSSLESWRAIKEDDKGLLEDHAWFVAFSPIDNPDIALSVIVEHGGHGGSAAGPIAKAMIEAYRSKKDSGAVSETR